MPRTPMSRHLSSRQHTRCCWVHIRSTPPDLMTLAVTAPRYGYRSQWGRAWGSRHLGGPRQCLRVDILSDVRQFAVSNCNGENPMVLKRPIRGFDPPDSQADDQNPVSLRYELGGLWIRSFHRFVSLLK